MFYPVNSLVVARNWWQCVLSKNWLFFNLVKITTKNLKLLEAVCLVRCLGRSRLISSLSLLVNKLFGGILSCAQTLIRSFTERQLSHKVHAYLAHNLCLTRSQGTKDTKKSSCPSHSQLVSSSFITLSQMTKHTASNSADFFSSFSGCRVINILAIFH